MSEVDELDAYPGGWFGESWGAAVCIEETHRETPTGEPCVECTRPIELGNQGLIIPHCGEAGKMRLTAEHLACFLWGLGVDPADWRCLHCGDATERGEDPKARLCAMCAKADRT